MLLRQRLQERKRLLQLSRIAFDRLELFRLELENVEQLLDLDLLCEGNATELLDVTLASKVHITSRSRRAIERKHFRLDDARRERAAPNEPAALDEQRELARRELHALAVVPEQRSESTASSRF